MACQNKDGRYVRVRKRLVQDKRNQPEWRKKIDNLGSPRPKACVVETLTCGWAVPDLEEYVDIRHWLVSRTTLTRQLERRKDTIPKH